MIQGWAIGRNTVCGSKIMQKNPNQINGTFKYSKFAWYFVKVSVEFEQCYAMCQHVCVAVWGAAAAGKCSVVRAGGSLAMGTQFPVTFRMGPAQNACLEQSKYLYFSKHWANVQHSWVYCVLETVWRGIVTCSGTPKITDYSTDQRDWLGGW